MALSTVNNNSVKIYGSCHCSCRRRHYIWTALCMDRQQGHSIHQYSRCFYMRVKLNASLTLSMETNPCCMTHSFSQQNVTEKQSIDGPTWQDVFRTLRIAGIIQQAHKPVCDCCWKTIVLEPLSRGCWLALFICYNQLFILHNTIVVNERMLNASMTRRYKAAFI